MKIEIWFVGYTLSILIAFGTMRFHACQNDVMKNTKIKMPLRTLSKRLSKTMYFHASGYRFRKDPPPPEKRYGDGALKAIDWIQQLCYHYTREDERLKREFVGVLEDGLGKIREPKRSPKTQGMADMIEVALRYLKSPPKSSKRGCMHRSSLTVGELHSGETGHSCR